MREETNFFSLNKPSDWEKGNAFHLQISDAGIRLAQVERFGWLQNIQLGQIEGPDGITDLTLDGERRLYLIDPSANVWCYDSANRHIDLLFPAGHDLFTGDASIEVAGGLLVVAERMGARPLAAYSLSTRQTVWEISEWKGTAIHPLALTTDGSEHVYVLFPQTVVQAESGNIAVPADTRFCILQCSIHGQVKRVYEHESLQQADQTMVADLQNRFFLAVGPDDSLRVLDTVNRWVSVFDGAGEWVENTMLSAPQPAGLFIDRHQALYVGDGREHSAEGEDDRFILQFASDGRLEERVAGFRGRVDKVFGRGGQMYIWNRARNLVTVLEQQLRNKTSSGLGESTGVYVSHALDTCSTETIWHKITVDADLPDEVQLKISSYASDRQDLFIDGEYVNLDDYLADPSRPLPEKLQRLQGLWSQPIINAKDALLNAQGRYLWLKIEWSGSEDKSPVLNKVRVHYPRASYLDDLPAVYQQDPASRDFLERFLSLFGTFFGEMEDTIDHISRFFDPDVVEGDMLRWLATWLGITVDERWTEAQVRELMRKGPLLFQKRGTRQGLEELIEIFLGVRPLIVEFFQYKHLIEKAEIQDYMDRLYGLDPYRFSVLVKPGIIQDEQQRAIVQKILDEEAPAFTEASLVVLEPLIHLGGHSYLGINTFLTEPNLLVLDNKSAMPYNTVLVDVDRNNRIGLHTRLGLDSNIE